MAKKKAGNARQQSVIPRRITVAGIEAQGRTLADLFGTANAVKQGLLETISQQIKALKAQQTHVKGLR